MLKKQRLIDAIAAVELLRSLGSRDYRREKNTISDAMKMLSHPAYTPTVDAVEVVRCRDCRFWVECESSLIGKVMCCTGQGDVKIQKSADDFCSYGERRARE